MGKELNTEIPEAEKWLYENPEALQSVRRGLRDSIEGRLIDLGSFQKYISIVQNSIAPSHQID